MVHSTNTNRFLLNANETSKIIIIYIHYDYKIDRALVSTSSWLILRCLKCLVGFSNNILVIDCNSIFSLKYIEDN